MSDYKIVYLILERGAEPNRQVFWRPAGNAFVCRDGSLNLKLDIHPGLTFNIRDPKSNGEREEAEPAPVSASGSDENQMEAVTFPNLGNGEQRSVKNVGGNKRPPSTQALAHAQVKVEEEPDIPF